jgi:hypothetical protein
MEELAALHDDRVFLRREALDHDYNDVDLAHAVRDGFLARVRHGAYTLADLWASANDVQKHKLRSHAVLRSHSSKLALSHTSAAVEHQLRLHRPDLDKVHVTCLDRYIARTTRDVVYHQGKCSDDDLGTKDGVLLVNPVRAGLETASLGDTPQGLVVLDSVVDLDLGTVEDIRRRFAPYNKHPKSRHVQVAVRLVRKGANSVGESLSRHLMFRCNLPEPVLQFEVRDARGKLIGCTDFAWPEYGLLGEFDGLSKYGRLLKPGETPEQAVIREKKREDRLREITSWLMVRLIWKELFRVEETAARIREQLERGRTLLVA